MSEVISVYGEVNVLLGSLCGVQSFVTRLHVFGPQSEIQRTVIGPNETRCRTRGTTLHILSLVIKSRMWYHTSSDIRPMKARRMENDEVCMKLLSKNSGTYRRLPKRLLLMLTGKRPRGAGAIPSKRTAQSNFGILPPRLRQPKVVRECVFVCV